uniref:Peptidase C1A papain C-terminal domain-containing protein n=1 Tax=Zooxanthella nutricula TaxID=1333877 RepID=A0A7S2K5U9_9DINO|mmetsp:Transcript_42448/g.128300  ORF Transcript_42448/g.128300 Transcript_42448/m.128300 type:complete len:435 (+) Transcript_42448:88-1392(+)
MVRSVLDRCLAYLALLSIASPIASGTSTGRSTTHDEAYPSFRDHCEMYKLSYSGSEWQKRQALYNDALGEIKAQNAKSSKSWSATVNRFMTLTPGEMTGFFGLSGVSSKRGLAIPRGALSTEPPGDKDWRTKQPSVVTAVKDQGHCGSCWAFAATAAMESAVAISTGILWNLSPQQVTSCAPNPNKCGGTGGCSGATAQIAFNYVRRVGIASEWAYSYSSYYGDSGTCKDSADIIPVAGIRAFRQVQPNVASELIRAVLLNPVAVSVAASKWRNYGEGVFGYDDCDLIVNHNVVLMGYGKTDRDVSYWLLRNSWGPAWGESGYIRLERAGSGEEERCGWDTDPQAGSACEEPLDGSNPAKRVWVCGACGVLSDSSYPIDAFLGKPVGPSDPALDNTSLVSAQRHNFAGLPEGADGAAFLQVQAAAGGHRQGSEL